MRVLITGSGVHCCQFVEALMFHKQYELTVYSDQNTPVIDRIKGYGITVANTDLPIIAAEADIIILADVPKQRLLIVNSLKSVVTDALILVDKPTTVLAKDEKELQGFLKDKRHLVAYSRFFEMNKVLEAVKSLSCAKKINVSWPNFFEFGIEILQDTLPHALELLFILSPDFTQGEDNWSYEYTDKQLSLHFLCGGKEYDFVVFNTTDKEQKVTVNGIQLDWLNYFNYIPAMLQCLVGQDSQFFENNHRFNDSINQIFFDITERNK